MDSLKEILSGAWDNNLERKRRGAAAKREYVYASQRRACTRAMALDMMHPEDQGEFDIHTLERFEQGNENEEALLARLSQAGKHSDPPFRVIGGQREFTHEDRDGNTIIKGKVDGEVQFDYADRGRAEVTIEVKSGNAVIRCNSIEDLDRGFWTRHMMDQLLSYLLGLGRRQGALLLRKPMQRPTVIPVNLEDHLDRAESFLQQATEACDARHGRGDMPDFTDDKAECMRCCHLGKSCVPPDVQLGAGAELLMEPSWAEDAVALVKLQDNAREHARLKRLMNDRLKGALGLVEKTVILPGVVARTSIVRRKGFEVKPTEYLKINWEAVDGKA